MKFYSIFIIVLCLLFLSSCGNETKPKKSKSKPKKEKVIIPSFNADSAYEYVRKQVDFGPL